MKPWTEYDFEGGKQITYVAIFQYFAEYLNNYEFALLEGSPNIRGRARGGRGRGRGRGDMQALY